MTSLSTSICGSHGASSARRPNSRTGVLPLSEPALAFVPLEVGGVVLPRRLEHRCDGPFTDAGALSSQVAQFFNFLVTKVGGYRELNERTDHGFIRSLFDSGAHATYIMLQLVNRAAVRE